MMAMIMLMINNTLRKSLFSRGKGTAEIVCVDSVKIMCAGEKMRDKEVVMGQALI